MKPRNVSTVSTFPTFQRFGVQFFPQSSRITKGFSQKKLKKKMEEDDDPFAYDDVEDDPFACDDDDDDDDDDDGFGYEGVDEDGDGKDEKDDTSNTEEKDESEAYILNTPEYRKEYVLSLVKKHGHVLNSIYRKVVRERAEKIFKNHLDEYKLEDMNRRLHQPTQKERQVMDIISCSKEDAKQALEMCVGDVSNAINLFLQGVLRATNNGPGGGPRGPVHVDKMVHMSTEDMNAKRKRDILTEQIRVFTKRWKHVITLLSEQSCSFLLRDGTEIIWEQMLMAQHFDEDVDRGIQCLDRFVKSVGSVEKKDFLQQLLKPDSLPWLWRRVSTIGNNADCSKYLDDILSRKTPSSEYALKFGQLQLYSDEIDIAELAVLCSRSKEFSVSCSSNNSFVIIQGGRDVDTNVVSNGIYCLYSSVLEVDPPRLPSVYVTRLSSEHHRYGHASAIVEKDSLYFVCGGKGKMGSPYENELFWQVAKIDSDGTNMSWIPSTLTSQQKSNIPSPRINHCAIPFRCKNRSGVVCFGGIDARSGKSCTDVWMMWMDETTTWYSLHSSKNVMIKSGYCVESRDKSVVLSLCDVDGLVVYATLCFSKGVVIWNDNMASPRILASISGEMSSTAAHVRVFGDSCYFTIQKSSGNDVCCVSLSHTQTHLKNKTHKNNRLLCVPRTIRAVIIFELRVKSRHLSHTLA